MTLDELRHIAELLPPGGAITIPREALRAAFGSPTLENSHERANGAAPTWREKLWTCPAETRLGVREVAEAMGRARSFVYRAVAAKQGAHRLPATRLGGELMFEAGAVRDWIGAEAGAP